MTSDGWLNVGKEEILDLWDANITDENGTMAINDQQRWEDNDEG